MLSRPVFAAAHTLFVALIALGLAACSEDKKQGDEAQKVSFTNAPCDNELMGDCGGSCSVDEDCELGLHCSSGHCTAECSEEGKQCDGTCSDRGRCEGEVIVGVKTPVQSGGDEPLINSEPEPSPTPILDQDAAVGAACATVNASASLTQVNLLIMLDKSGSMDNENKWPDATAALTAFLEDPATAGIGVALRFFGSTEPVPGCDRDSCDMDACSQPLVDLGVLTAADQSSDTQEATLVQTIDDAAPEGGFGTPIYPALGGAVQWAAARNQANPNERTVVVFVTDGEPNGCNENIDDISSLAADGLANADVLTYAIGLEGSNEAQMDQIAQAGGTDNGIFVGAGANAQQDLVDALNAIRGQTIACDFAIPDPPNGQTLDPNKVNVRLTSPSNGESRLYSVTEEAECDNDAAWYYDSPDNPTRVYLCPAACDLALSEPDSQLEVLIGCMTEFVPGIAR